MITVEKKTWLWQDNSLDCHSLLNKIEETMLTYLKQCSQHRTAWLLLAVSAFLLELVALYFQHVMQLNPCVMCVYQRCALFGVMLAGLVGAIAPRLLFFRGLALIIWLYSAVQGIWLAWQHTLLQLHPSPFATCDFFVSFPRWLPLDKWVPSVFFASGDCSVSQWQFLSLVMPQWMLGIFAVYLLIALIVLLSQVSKKHH